MDDFVDAPLCAYNPVSSTPDRAFGEQATLVLNTLMEMSHKKDSSMTFPGYDDGMSLIILCGSMRESSSYS